MIILPGLNPDPNHLGNVQGGGECLQVGEQFSTGTGMVASTQYLHHILLLWILQVYGGVIYDGGLTGRGAG